MELKDKVVVITGASSGIGEELAYQFSKLGNKVVLAARNAERLEKIAGSIRSAGGQALAVQTDVAVREQVERLMKTAFQSFGRIDIVINNAGIAPAVGTIIENSEEDIRKTMEVNFMGGIYGVRAAVPYMEKGEGGQIVFVSSIVGKRGVPRSSSYCASKFAVQGLAESIRPELKRKNIRVITICPPGVDTPFFSNNGKPVRRPFRLHPVSRIARGIISACRWEKREVLLTMDAKLLNLLNLLFPRFVDWISAKAKGV